MKWQTVSLGHTLGCFTHWSVWFDWNPFIYFLPKSTFLLCISSNTQGCSSVTVLKLFVLCVCHYSAVCVCLSVACSALVAYQYAFTSFLYRASAQWRTNTADACLSKLCSTTLLSNFIYSVCTVKGGKLLQRMWFLMSYLENEHPHDTLASDFYASGFMCWRNYS